MKNLLVISLLFFFYSCIDNYENEVRPVVSNGNGPGNNDYHGTNASAKVSFNFVFCNQFMGEESEEMYKKHAPDTEIRIEQDGATYISHLNDNGKLVIDDLPVTNGFNLIHPIKYDVYFKNRYYFSDSIKHAGIFDYARVVSDLAVIDVSDTEIMDHDVELTVDSLGHAIIRFSIKAIGQRTDDIWRLRGAMVFISNNPRPNESNAALRHHYLALSMDGQFKKEHNGIIDFRLADIYNEYSSNQPIYYSIYGISGGNGAIVSGYEEAILNGKDVSLAFPTISEDYAMGELQF